MVMFLVVTLVYLFGFKSGQKKQKRFEQCKLQMQKVEFTCEKEKCTVNLTSKIRNLEMFIKLKMSLTMIYKNYS